MSLRQSNLERLDTRDFDALIVGGGINGAVCASALTSRGAAVALIDRGDFASRTSQESSNLIWGGIKYLEGFEFRLVRKLCKSRNHLIENYPATVEEIRFLTTLDKRFRWWRSFIWLASWLYWVIGGGFTRTPRLLSRRGIKAEEPIVDVTQSQGGLEYSDAFMVDNDARFVWSFVRAAMDHGGVAANYVESLGAERGEDGIWVTRARDRMSGREITIRSKILINACGPWVDEHNTLLGVRTEHRHVFSKGIHLVVKRLSRVKRALAFFASDGRLFFVIPLGARSCIGTTDTRVSDPNPTVTAEDRRFVLDNINRLLDLEEPLTAADVIAERCGVRPLVVEPGNTRDEGDWTSLSRKHQIEVSEPERHVSIFGGKLTDCLNIGDEVSRAAQRMGVELRYPTIKWYGEPPKQFVDEFHHQASMMHLDDMTHPDSSEPLSSRLWRRYGAKALRILEDIRQNPAMGDLLIEGTEYIRAELHLAAHSEMVTKLEDFLRRRSKIALVVPQDGIREAPGLMEACRILFGAEAQARYDEYFGAKGGDPLV